MINDEKISPLAAIYIGSFDLLTGIRICYQKNYGKLVDQQIEDIVKISLSNVHRQEQKPLENFYISTIEIQCFQLFVENAIFNISSQTKNKFNNYYSVGLIFDSTKMRQNEHLNNMLIFWTKILAYNVQNLLIQNNAKQNLTNTDYSSLEDIYDRVSEECCILIQSQIDNLPSFDLIKPFDSNFFTSALTSHLQTQMTTVIEFPSDDDNECQSLSKSKNFGAKIKLQVPKRSNSLQNNNGKFSDLACFLAHFTLPFQRELSSLEIRQYPTPGLFLQCVSSQKVPIEEFLSISPRPTTWIRLQDKKIFRTSENLFIDQYKNAIQSNFFSSNENDSNNSNASPYIWPFWSKLKKDSNVSKMIDASLNSSEWASLTVSEIQQSMKLTKSMLASQLFSSLIRLVFAFISIKNEKLDDENNDALSQDQLTDIFKNELDIENNDDILIIASIAQIYDEKTYKQMQNFLSNAYK